MEDVRDLVIIGSGPSGYSAAIYTSRAEINTLLISGPEVGGQLTTTTEVENYAGFAEGIQGPELMEEMKRQAARFGTEYMTGMVTSCVFSDDPETTPHVLTVDESTEVKARTVIIATGASAKYLGLESETTFRGKGISACATCDGYFFKGKDVIVVGAGDVAMEETVFLSKLCNSVTVLVRGDQESMKASKVMQKRALGMKNVTFLFNTEADEFLGDDLLSGVRVKNNQTGETQELAIQGAFIAIGHKPNSDAFVGSGVEIDEKGYIHPVDQSNSMETNKKGVYVAGDINDYKYRQAITAAGEGCMAALDAERYLSSLE
ncbi:MAG: thioredoxin-disulfide reductase [Candidatus Doudnabacteria bacterium]|nr:thioredoxin-disulfide reductase [Candidatus Doudnabacteria bacterium]